MGTVSPRADLSSIERCRAYEHRATSSKVRLPVAQVLRSLREDEAVRMWGGSAPAAPPHQMHPLGRVIASGRSQVLGPSPARRAV